MSQTKIWLASWGLCVVLIATLPSECQTQVLNGEVSDHPAFTAMVGGSVLEYTFAGDQPFRGIVGRVGATLSSYFDATLLGEAWAIENRGATWSAHLEAAYFPLGRRRVSPFVLLSGGYFRSDRRTPAGTSFAGTSAALGAGARVRVWDAAIVQVEGILRTDIGGGSDELRAFVGYAPGDLEVNEGQEAAMAGVVYQMMPVAGPWRFRGPGYAARFSTRIDSTFSAGLGVGILHLRMINELYPGSYTWDTRSAILLPGVVLDRQLAGSTLSLRIGPGMTAMLEGPDAGARFGAHSEVSIAGRVGPVPVILGAGAYWIARPEDQGGALPGEDLQAFSLFAGIGR